MSITIHGVVEAGAELVSTLQVGGELRSEAYTHRYAAQEEGKSMLKKT